MEGYNQEDLEEIKRKIKGLTFKLSAYKLLAEKIQNDINRTQPIIQTPQQEVINGQSNQNDNQLAEQNQAGNHSEIQRRDPDEQPEEEEAKETIQQHAVQTLENTHAQQQPSVQVDQIQQAPQEGINQPAAVEIQAPIIQQQNQAALVGQLQQPQVLNQQQLQQQQQQQQWLVNFANNLNVHVNEIRQLNGYPDYFLIRRNNTTSIYSIKSSDYLRIQQDGRVTVYNGDRRSQIDVVQQGNAHFQN